MKLRLLFCVLCAPIIVGAQTFTDISPTNIPGLESGDVAWADYNNDGYLDFAVMGLSSTASHSAIYSGSSNGTFQLLGNNSMPRMRDGDIDWGDFDNDGDLDLAMTGRIETAPWEVTVIMRNNITAFDQFFTTSGSQGGSLAWLDYDNDGDLDLYQVGSFFDNSYPNSIFINMDGKFSAGDVFHVKGYYSELLIDHTVCVATDFDNDGDQDIFSSGQYSHGVWNEASLLINGGVKNVENTDQYRFSYNDLAIRNGSVNQADFNKDGRMDYFLTGNSSSINDQNVPFSQLMLGTGDGNFLRKGKLLDVYNSSSDVGDIDNDGDLDIIISGQFSGNVLTKIYLNDGLANFTELSSVELPGLSLCTVTLADYDNDGDLDVLMIGRTLSNQKSIKLYRNNLLTKPAAPNEKPSAPSNLRFRMENNSVILEWDKGSDKETPSGTLTYNVYVAISPKKPFKMFPQSNADTGKRKVYEHGNTSVNTRWTLKELKTGTYYFSVQSIDGANAGSGFADEIAFKYTRIDTQGPACQNSEQVFLISPPASYNWKVAGGKIISGQDSETIKVQWEANPVNPRITADGVGTSNSLIPVLQPIPSAQIAGPTIVCDLESYNDYKPFAYSQSMSYTWNIDGDINNNAMPSFRWNSPGNKEITLAVTNPLTGCKNQSTIKVAVSERVDVGLNYSNGLYTPIDIKFSYSYRWEKYIDDWSTVSTANSFEPQSTGNYRLLVINQYGCSYSKSFFVNKVVTGIENQPGKFQIFPNPAVTEFSIVNLSRKGKAVDVFINDITGRNVLIMSTVNEVVSIDCSSFARGVYIVKILADGEMEYSKLVIE